MFGCGNRDWVQTYQRVPRLVDELLGNRGGKPLLPRGEGDAGGSDIFNDFDIWEDRLFKKLTEVTSLVPPVCLVVDIPHAQVYRTKSSTAVSSIEIRETTSGTERATTLRQGNAALGEVISNTVLTAPGKPLKRHLGETSSETISLRLTFAGRVRTTTRPEIQRWRLSRHVRNYPFFFPQPSLRLLTRCMLVYRSIPRGTSSGFSVALSYLANKRYSTPHSSLFSSLTKVLDHALG